MASDQSWFSRLLSAFSSLFSSGAAKEPGARSPVQTTSQARRMAGHWPVWIELSKTTREQHPPRDDSALTLRFSATDGPLLKSMGINTRDFNGSYVPDKNAGLVQIPERLVQELMRKTDSAVFVEAFLDGESLGARKFTIPLRF